jgi:hypothetical protein
MTIGIVMHRSPDITFGSSKIDETSDIRIVLAIAPHKRVAVSSKKRDRLSGGARTAIAISQFKVTHLKTQFNGSRPLAALPAEQQPYSSDAMASPPSASVAGSGRLHVAALRQGALLLRHSKKESRYEFDQVSF